MIEELVVPSVFELKNQDCKYEGTHSSFNSDTGEVKIFSGNITGGGSAGNHVILQAKVSSFNEYQKLVDYTNMVAKIAACAQQGKIKAEVETAMAKHHTSIWDAL